MKMFSVEMTLEEINELGRIVDRERKDLRSEIHHTDDFDFRNILKSRDRLLQDMLIRINNCKPLLVYRQ